MHCVHFVSIAAVAARCYSHEAVETDEEFDARWVTYFSKPDIDAWELKKGDSYSEDVLLELCCCYIDSCDDCKLGSVRSCGNSVCCMNPYPIIHCSLNTLGIGS